MRDDDVHSIGSWADSEYPNPPWTTEEIAFCLSPYQGPGADDVIDLTQGYIPYDAALLHINPFAHMDFPKEEGEPEGYFVGEVDDALLEQWENDSMWEPWEEDDLQDVVPERHNAVFTFVDDFLVIELVPYIYVHMSYLLFRLQCPLPASVHGYIMPIVRIFTMNQMLPPLFLPHQLFHGFGLYLRSPATPPQEESLLRYYTPLSLSPSGSPLAGEINSVEISDSLDDVLATFRLFWERESSSFEFTLKDVAENEATAEDGIFMLEN